MRRQGKSRIVVPDMSTTFEPRLDILPDSQRRLWPELDLDTLRRVPLAMQKDLTRWAQAVDLSRLPAVHARRGLSPRGLEK